jgi:chromosome segregation ATPase
LLFLSEPFSELANANIARTQASSKNLNTIVETSTSEESEGELDERDSMILQLSDEFEKSKESIAALKEQLDTKTIEFHILESQIEDLNGRILDKTGKLLLY